MSDAWLFLSIGDAGGCAEWVGLRHLLSAADSINHAIPTVEELESSVSKLIAAGLAAVDGTRTRLTPSGCATYSAANRPKVGHVQRMFDLADEWRAAEFPPDAPISWRLGEGDLEAGYAEYTQHLPDKVKEWMRNPQELLGSDFIPRDTSER